ncbi:MarR family winged helix-turn-helix transcriptional regulator [Deinococcus radiophilus]|uniref:Transcriptional regulator n=1 Tax=Deinococcus radiophilus TaxID=32062 RepID=A0A431VPP4_9DEIO|nr:winged helix DNA-binding protein [Deinococcus radiophilus]RTR24708.1 transcriptional regulator [Deinococcus radiophilus]UFA51637.1 winged helix DNA-binding protein [Deinococcus radiophilus]
MSLDSPAATSLTDQLHDEQILRFLGGLWQLNRRLKSDILPLLTPLNLDLRLYFILLNIRRGQVHPKAIAENLDFPASLLSRYLEQLRTSGYIERQLDPADSRRIRLELTPAGVQVLEDAINAIKLRASERLQHLDPARLDALLEAIELLSDLDLQPQDAESNKSPFPKPSEEPV